MRIAIAGGPGAFRDILAGRLNREKHELYTISGKSGGRGTSGAMDYSFDLNDDKLKLAMHSIMPDAVVFLGALDERYDFSDEQRAAMEYLSGLSNILITLSSLGISRFVYLSTSQVYGTRRKAALTEQSEPNPANVRAMLIAQGETMCLEFNRLKRMEAVVLRLSNVYGLCSPGDFCGAIFAEADALRKKGATGRIGRDVLLSPVYATDAVDAVYKALTVDNGPGVYNVSGGQTKLSHIRGKIMELRGVECEHEGAEKAEVNLTVDCRLFSAKYGYRPLVDIDAGLERMNRDLNKQIKKEQKSRRRQDKRGMKLIMPLLENLVLFVLIAFIQTQAEAGAAALSGIDLMAPYIVLIAASSGLFQGGIAVVLSCGLLVFRLTGGMFTYEAFLSLKTLLIMLEYLIIGIICGYSRDHARAAAAEKGLELEENQRELEAVYSINDQNVRIKQALDERLTNYEDSLARMYTVVDRLNSLEPDMVFFSAVEVVMDIMRSNDVSIYVVTGDEFKMCRLMAKTPSSSRNLKNSVPLADMGALAEAVGNDEIFVNRELDASLPMMAAPVFSGRNLESIIMLWDVGFENLSLYTVNRFMVLSRLISSVIERAYVYAESMRDQSCVPGTEALTAEAFKKILLVHKQAERNQTSVHTLLFVSGTDGAGNELGLKELALKTRPMLRVNDYMGELEGSGNDLLVLLASTSRENAGYVRSRLEEAGLIVNEGEI